MSISYRWGGCKGARQRFARAVKALTVAYALSGASDEALTLREEVAFFQAVHVSLSKTLGTGGGSFAARELAVQQLIDQAVQSADVVDILAAAGLERPDISILSEEFLAEVQGLKTRNLALEALQKLLTDSLKMRSKTHVVQVKAFTERLESAMLWLSTGPAGRRRKARAPAGRIPHRSVARGGVGGGNATWRH